MSQLGGVFLTRVLQCFSNLEVRLAAYTCIRHFIWAESAPGDRPVSLLHGADVKIKEGVVVVRSV